MISVGDDGPGIPEEKARGGSSEPRRPRRFRGSGAGLGLSIVTDIANAWFGSLTLVDGAPDYAPNYASRALRALSSEI